MRRTKGAKQPQRAPLMMALEPRIMFDGAAAATSHASQVEHHPILEHHESVLANVASPVAVAATSDRNAELLRQLHVPDRDMARPPSGPAVLFIDSRVQDPASLLKDVTASTEVVYLNAQTDGLEQIASYLKQHHEVSSVEIIAHGGDGNLLLGSTDVNAANLNTFSATLGVIGRNLRAGADILVYACSTAADAQGVAFADALAKDTGHAVAASSNVTGNGGDWNLEFATGDITAKPVLSAKSEASYSYTLGSTAVSTAAQLNAAILADDLDLTGNDMITLTSNITYASALDAATITHLGVGTLTIDGGGFTINAAYLSRVLTVTAGNVILQNVTLEHGLLAGAGVALSAPGSNELGAGIYNAGTLTLNNVTVTQNVATGGGGGGAGVVGAGGGGGSGAGGSGGAPGGGLTGALGSGSSGGKGAGTDAGIGGTSSGGGAGGVFIGIAGASGGAGATASSAGLTAGGGGGGAGYIAGNGGAGGDAAGGVYNAGSGKLFVIGSSAITNNLAAGGGGGGGTGSLLGVPYHGGVGGQGVGGIWNSSTGLVYVTGAAYSAMTGNVGANGTIGAATNGASNSGITTAAAAAKVNSSGTVIIGYVPVPPTVSSINVVGSSPNNAGSDQFVVTFSEPVTGVIATDFTLHDTGTVAGVITSVTGSGSSYTVNVSPVTGDGTMRLDLNSSLTGIVDGSGNAIAGGYTSGQTYTIEHTPPLATSITTVATSPNSATSEQFTVTFSENVTGVGVGAFNLTNTGTVGGNIAAVSAVSGSVYTVTVNNVTGNGTMQLNLNGSGTGIADTAGNALVGGALSEQFYTITHTLPTVTAITTVGANPNNASSDQFNVTFSEAVTGVNVADFLLHDTGTVAGAITSVTGSGANYMVTVGSVAGDGTMRLDVNAINTVIDSTGNVMAGGYTSGQTYSIDHTPPVATSIVTVGSNPNNASTEQFTVTFSESVTGVTSAAFSLLNTGTVAGAIASVSGSGSSYTVTVSGVTGNGTMELNLNATGTGIIDASGNGVFGGFAGQVYGLQHTQPTVTSITTVGGNPNNAANEQFDVTFSENVTGVNLADFSLHDTGTAAGVITSITGSGANYVVTVGTVSGDGTMRLDLNALNTVIDAAGNATGGGYTGGQVYTIEHTPPVANSIATVSVNPNDASSEQFTVTFSENVSGVTTGAFSLLNTGTVAGTIASVTPVSGSVYTVTVGGVSGDGTMQLNLNTSGTGISDTAGNALIGGALLDQAYVVEHTQPVVTSITTVGNNPNNATSEQFDVSFSENVTGVNVADFSLHNAGLTGGIISAVSGSGSNYVVTVSAVLGNGSMRLDLNAINTVIDAAGNLTAGGYTGGQVYTIEQTPPVAISINTVGSNPNNANSDQFTVNFSESVSGVSASAFTLFRTGSVSGSIASVTGSGSVYTVTVGGVSGDGTLQLGLNATGTGISDAAGNALVGGALVSPAYLIEHTAPSVTSITTVGANPNNTGSEQFTVNFSESVSGVNVADFALHDTGTVAGTITSVTGSGSTYTVLVSPVVGDGTMQLQLNAVNTVVDAAGNSAAGYTSGQAYTIEHTAPVATSITANSGDTSSAASEQFTVNFSENVTGVTANDFTLAKTGTVGGTIGSVSGSGSTYTVMVNNVTGIGTMQVNLNASGTAIVDAAGNPLAGGALGQVYGITHTLPAVTSITTVGPNPSNASSEQFTVNFSENVTGVNVADFSLSTTGTAGGIISSVTGSGSTYTVTVSPAIGDGTMRLDLNAINTVIDATGNLTAGGYSGGQTYVIEHTPPVATSITTVGPNPNNAAMEQFTVNFSENVSGVTANDFTLINTGTVTGSIASVTSVSASVYTVTVNNVGGDGTMQLQLNASGTGIADLAGNAIVGGAIVSQVYAIEHTAPAVTSITTIGANPTNAPTEQFAVNFSENVVGVTAADFSLTDTGTVTGNITAVSGSGSAYVVTVGSVADDGTMRLDLNSVNTVVDTSGNVTPGYSGGQSFTVDHTPPQATSISAAAGDTSASTSDNFTVNFSENVSGVTTADFSLVNTGGVTGNITSVTAISGSSYNVTVDGVHGTGTMELNLNSGTGITDAAGNTISGGLSGTPFNVASTAPSVTSITTVGANPTNAGSEAFTVNFSENVTGVGANDFSLTTTGSVATGTVAVTGSGSTYTVTVSGVSGDGTLGLDLNASGTAIQDFSGNVIAGGFSSGQTYTIDHTAPVVTAIATVGGSPNNAASDQFTVTFSENVSGVATGDFSLTDGGGVVGTIASVTQVTGSTYTVTVNGVAGDGSMRLDLNSNAAGITDTAGNAITAGFTGGQVYSIEHTAPTVTSIDTNGATTNNANSETFTVDFSENVSGVTASDFSLANSGTVTGSIGAITAVSASEYTVTVNGVAGDGSMRLDLNASSNNIQDAAGNSAAAAFSTGQSYTIEHTPPIATSIVPVDSNPNNASSDAFTVNFSEGVSGVTAADFTLAKTGSVTGSITSVTPVSASSYTVLVSNVAGTGLLGLDLNVSGTAIADAAGNAILGGYVTGVPYIVNHSPPTVTAIDTVGASPNNANSDQFTVDFSENVSGVTAGDFTLTTGGTVAGSIASVTGSGSVYTVTVNGVSGDGTMRLDLNASGTGIMDAAHNPISGGYASGQSYSIEHTAPVVTSSDVTSSGPNNASSETFAVNFSESVTGVTASDFVLSNGGSVVGTVASVSGTGSAYTVTVNNVTGDGTMRLDLNGTGAGISDAAGNSVGATFTGGQSYTIQHTAPAVSTINIVGAATNNATTETFAVNFTESVTGVTANDFTVTTGGTVTGAVGSVSGSGSSYTVTVTGVAGDGTLGLDLNASGTGITDAAGNPIGSGYTAGQTYTIAHTAPAVASIDTTGASANNASTETFAVNFTESVSGVNTSDFVLSNTGSVAGTVAAVSGSGSAYTVTVTGVTGDGNMRLDLNGNGAGITDTAGNSIATGYSSGQSYSIEHTAPQVTSIDVAGSNPNHASTETFTVNFSESVNGVSVSDFTLTNTGTVAGSISAVSGSGSLYTVTVSGVTGDGTMRLDLNGSSAGITDAAGNALGLGFNTGQYYTIEHTAPQVTSIAITGSTPNNASTETFAVNFSENVSGVTASDFVLANSGTVGGTIGAVSGSGSAYTVTVNNVTGDGTMRLDLHGTGPGIADAAGNALVAGYSSGQSYTIAHFGPQVNSIDVAGSSPNNASTETFTVSFSESVIGVTANDFNLSTTGSAAGTIASVSGSGGTYTVTVNGVTGDGTMRLNLNARGNAITDLLGNAIGGGFTAGQWYTIEHTPPAIVSIDRVGAATNNAGTETFAVNFSEVVSGVSANDFVLTNGGTVAGTIGAVTGSGSAYTVTVNGVTGDGTMRLDLNGLGGGISDLAGNLVASGFTSGEVFTIGHTAPTVSSINVVGSGTNDASSETFTVNFSENVSGVNASDFTLTNSGSVTGNITHVTGSGSVYTVTVGGVAGTGTMRLDLNAVGTGIVDAAGNAIAAGFSGGQVITLGASVPEVSSITVAGNGTNNADTEAFTVNFSANVTGVAANDFVLTTTGTVAGTISSITGSGSVYVVTVSGVTGDGTLGLALNGTGSGIVNSLGTALGMGFSTGLTYTVDHTVPTLTLITAAGPSTTNASSEQYTVQFSENVSGVDAADFVLATAGTAVGTITSVTGSDSTYTVTVGNLSGDGTLGVALNGAGTSIADLAGNAIGGAPVVGGIVNVDHIAPTLTAITPVSSGLSNAATEQFTVTFSENVTGVEVGFFSLVGTGTASGRIASISGSGNTYTVTVDEVAGNGTLALGLNQSAAAIADAAGNGLSGGSGGFGVPAGELVAAVQHTAPVVSAVTILGDPINDATSEQFKVVFSESVTGLTASDFTLVTTGTVAGTLGSALDTTAGGGLARSLGVAHASSVAGCGDTYIVTVDNVSGDGTMRLDVNGSGTGIVDAAGNAIAGGYTTGQTYTIEHSAPAVESVTLPSNSSYTSGQTLDITVTYDQVVALDTAGGTARIAITLQNGQTVYAVYAGGSGTDTLTFAYTVSGTDMSSGITVASNIDLNGAVLTDLAGNSGAASLGKMSPDTGVRIGAAAPVSTPVAVMPDLLVLSGNLDSDQVPVAAVFAPPAGTLPAPTVDLVANQTALNSIDLERAAPQLNSAIERQEPVEAAFAFTAPLGSFQFDPGSVVTVNAALANGAALPSWLHFDASSGKFEGAAPAGWQQHLHVIITARDQNGHEVMMPIEIRFTAGDGEGDAAQPATTDANTPDKSASLQTLRHPSAARGAHAGGDASHGAARDATLDGTRDATRDAARAPSVAALAQHRQRPQHAALVGKDSLATQFERYGRHARERDLRAIVGQV